MDFHSKIQGKNQHIVLPELEAKNYQLFIKREDQIHPLVSGNKFRKLKYNLKEALDQNIISRSQFDLLAIAINTGTNLPSVATPNGQAAFLFLLTLGGASINQPL